MHVLATDTIRRLVHDRPWIPQLVRFSLVGATGLVVDTAVLAAGTEFARLDPRLAAIPAFAFAVTWTYTMNRFWTFRARGRPGVRASYCAFVAVCLGGLAVRLGTMHLLMEYGGLGTGRRYYIASLAGILAATSINFLGSKFLAFPSSSGGGRGEGRSA